MPGGKAWGLGTKHSYASIGVLVSLPASDVVLTNTNRVLQNSTE